MRSSLCHSREGRNPDSQGGAPLGMLPQGPLGDGLRHIPWGLTVSPHHFSCWRIDSRGLS